MVGYVLVRAYSSSKSASQRTLDLVWCAPRLMRTSPRYEARPVPLETDFERIWEVVCGARCVKTGEDFPFWVLPVPLPCVSVTLCRADVLRQRVTPLAAVRPIVLAQESRRVVATGPACPC